MKSNLLPALLLSLAIMIGGYLIGDMHKRAKVYDRHVEVKGLAEREVEADLAVWPLELNLADNNLNALNSMLDKQKSRVNTFFKEMGFKEDEISMGVSSIIDRLASEYSGNQNFQFRFFGKAEITLRTTDLDKIQLAQEKSLALTSEGILIKSKNGWRPIEYIFTGLNEIKPEMIEEATVKAKEVAEKFAKDSNSKVGEIRSANQGLFTISDRDPSTPQVKKVRVVTTVEYLLED